MPRLELVLMIGRYAHAFHLRRLGRADLLRRTVTETVRDWRTIVATGTPAVLPMPHPSWRNTAWLAKNPWFEAELLPELRRKLALILAAQSK